MKISVIVPVYNVAPYLKKCLDSLVNQTIDDIEIIVVNDGSTDGSQKIIDEYQNKYPKLIKSFIKKNGGLSDARNFGIDKAKGMYIGFVDSDDYVQLDMFDKMYKKAISENFDIVVCDINYENGNNIKRISSLVQDDLNTIADIQKQMINIYPVAWNKIYKKNLFDYGIRFKKGVLYEDVEFLYRLFPYINSIGVVKEPLINYVQRNGAISKTFNRNLYHYIDNWNGIVDFYKSNGFYDKYFDELEYCYVRYLLATFVKGATHFPKNEYKIAVKEALKNIKYHFPNYKKNKYLNHSLKGLYLKFFNNFTANIIFALYSRR